MSRKSQVTSSLAPLGSTIVSAKKAALSLASSFVDSKEELKVYDALDGTTSMSTTINVASMNALSVGNTVTTRTGRSILVRGLVVQGWFKPADVSNVCRVTIALRHSGYTATPNIYTGPNIYSSSLTSTEEKLTFLSDDLVGFPTSDGTNFPTIPYSRTVRFKKGLPVTWLSNGNIGQNSLMVVLSSDSSAASHPSFVGFIRYYFTDA